MDDPDCTALKSPPKRRRSTFFEKRDSLSLTATESSVNVSQAPEESEEDWACRLKLYEQQLYREKETWKAECNERRAKYKELKIQILVEASATSVDYSVLTEEDIQFLNGKPKMKKMAKEWASFYESLAKTKDLINRWRTLDNVLMDSCQNNLNQIQGYILDSSSDLAVPSVICKEDEKMEFIVRTDPIVSDR